MYWFIKFFYNNFNLMLIFFVLGFNDIFVMVNFVIIDVCDLFEKFFVFFFLIEGIFFDGRR